jgi:recombinational DNA repair protein (RecF pathway)
MECYDREDESDESFVCADCGEEIDPKELYVVEDDKLCLRCLCDRFKMCVG